MGQTKDWLKTLYFEISIVWNQHGLNLWSALISLSLMKKISIFDGGALTFCATIPRFETLEWMAWHCGFFGGLHFWRNVWWKAVNRIVLSWHVVLIEVISRGERFIYVNPIAFLIEICPLAVVVVVVVLEPQWSNCYKGIVTYSWQLLYVWKRSGNYLITPFQKDMWYNRTTWP